MYDNEYEEQHPLQAGYNSFGGRCLCGRDEWCPACDGSNKRAQAVIVDTAIILGYQLYFKAWMKDEYIKVKYDETKSCGIALLNWYITRRLNSLTRKKTRAILRYNVLSVLDRNSISD